MTSTQPSNPWLNYPARNSNAALNLFCFPYAGGNSQVYRGWPEQLPWTVQTSTVQLPGREARLRETPYASLPALVAALCEAVLPDLAARPFAFFGHSMGALISYELTRELRRRGGPMPVRLFLSGRRAPRIRNEEPPTYDLPEAEFLESVRRFNGTPQEVFEHPELMRILLPLLRADFALVQDYAYAPEAPLDCPVSVFGGLQDRDVPREYLEAWREQTTASFSLRMLPGDHFFLRTSQPLLLSILSQQLRELLRGPC
ncbi:MAG: alpha/beta fold hydrolase [Acidobacteria bacterium]|nr:alpha/beta fold hydrolase [Acidobacteriota bacterium]